MKCEICYKESDSEPNRLFSEAILESNSLEFEGKEYLQKQTLAFFIYYLVSNEVNRSIKENITIPFIDSFKSIRENGR